MQKPLTTPKTKMAFLKSVNEALFQTLLEREASLSQGLLQTSAKGFPICNTLLATLYEAAKEINSDDWADDERMKDLAVGFQCFILALTTPKREGGSRNTRNSDYINRKKKYSHDIQQDIVKLIRMSKKGVEQNPNECLGLYHLMNANLAMREFIHSISDPSRKPFEQMAVKFCVKVFSIKKTKQYLLRLQEKLKENGLNSGGFDDDPKFDKLIDRVRKVKSRPT